MRTSTTTFLIISFGFMFVGPLFYLNVPVICAGYLVGAGLFGIAAAIVQKAKE